MRKNYPEFLIVHHTGGVETNPLADTSHHTFEIVDNYHRGLWNFRSTLRHYIGYHYFIDRNGKVTQGRADAEEGAHTRGMNLKSIGICLAGNFDATLPTKAQEDALRTLLQQLAAAYNIPVTKIVPHRKFSNKTCYGNKLDDQWAANLVKEEPKTGLESYSTLDIIKELQKRVTQMKKDMVA